MKPEEIKAKIDEQYAIIDKALSRGIFVLNPDIAKAYDTIEELQSQCLHQFSENGFCEYCGFSEENDGGTEE